MIYEGQNSWTCRNISFLNHTCKLKLHPFSRRWKCHSCKSMKHTQPLLTVMSILLNLRQTPEKKRPHQQLTLVTVAGNGVYLKIENLLIFVFWNMYRSYRYYCLLYQADKPIDFSVLEYVQILLSAISSRQVRHSLLTGGWHYLLITGVTAC